MKPTPEVMKLDPELIKLFYEAIKLTNEKARIDFPEMLFEHINKNIQIAEEKSKSGDVDFVNALKIAISRDVLPLWKFCIDGC